MVPEESCGKGLEVIDRIGDEIFGIIFEICD
jgi:hypothetical protein